MVHHSACVRMQTFGTVNRPNIRKHRTIYVNVRMVSKELSVSTTAVDVTSEQPQFVTQTPHGSRRATKMHDERFRARVLTPLLFIGMIVLPASILAAIAVFDTGPAASQMPSGDRANTAAVIDG